MKQEPQIILCPYCGHVQTVAEGAAVPDQCDECRGLFEPLSRQATQISMGPWYIRDKKNPFRPGCSYEVISKMAKNNRIRPTTVMRGPSTRQFWSVARNVPGVAHLLGYCHKCSAKVSPTDAACHACGAKFEEPKERNELGLAYRTAQEASAAQRALDKEIAAITGAPSPGGSGINPAITAAPGAGLLDEVLGGGKFGGSPLLNFGASPATTTTSAPPPPRPAGAASAAPGALPSLGGENSFAAGFRNAPAMPPAMPNLGGGAAPAAPAPAAYRAVDAFSLGGEADDTGIDEVQRKQRNASAMTWALIGFNAILVVVVIVFVIMNNKGKPAEAPRDNNTTKDSAPAAGSRRNGSTTPVADNTGRGPNGTNSSTGGNDDGGEATSIVNKQPIDPRLDRDVMNAKLAEAQALVDANDYERALPLMTKLRDDYPAAWLPDNFGEQIRIVTAELERRAAVAEDKKIAAEVSGLLARAKAHQDKNERLSTLRLLVQVRDNYPAKFHPQNLAAVIGDLEKGLDGKGQGSFFGQSTE